MNFIKIKENDISVEMAPSQNFIQKAKPTLKEEIKMTEQEDVGFTSPYKHIKITTTYRETLAEIDLGPGMMAPL